MKKTTIAVTLCAVVSLGALVSCGFFVDSWDPLRAADPSPEAADQEVVHDAGSLDTNFLATGAGANGVVRSIAVQRDGKILIGGDFTAYNDMPRGHIARLNPDGSLDNTFLTSGVGANYGVVAIAVQSNGKILIGGVFGACNSTPRGNIARLNADGTLDTGFLATDVGANDAVESIAVRSDEQILIGGAFSRYNDTARGHLARLNVDGTLDTGFLAAGVGGNAGVNGIAIKSDWTILIGGDFTTYNGTGPGRVARLSPNGGLDTDFPATGGAANDWVGAIAVQSNGKILIGGGFGTYNSTPRGHIARLNVDGTLDTEFLKTGVGTDGSVCATAVQGDGKILIGGYFGTYNGKARRSIARLNADGSLDTGFLLKGAGTDGYVYAIAVQSDGKILIGGTFTTCNGTSRGYIARLWN